ncbi:ABC transporter permease [Acholeplasma laidlawii]|uniref:ABC transporter permease n=1 Tax=Acholeplasma laidlawii TaxID=2148 RepID=UPI0018C2A21D|nr:ABC transporter permease [Acholeplasma laidlawii]MBG0762613.1 ABC transporter permease [Acholeplasma laidlawii]
MKKLKYLIKYGLKKRLFTKAFYISTAVIGVLIVGITLLPTIISSFADEPGGEIIDNRITIVDTTGYNFDDAIQTFIDISLLNLFDNQIEYLLSNDIPDATYYDDALPNSGLIYIYLEGGLVQVQVYNSGLNGYVTSILQSFLPNLQRLKYEIDNPGSTGMINDVTVDYVKDPNAEDTELQSIMSALSTAVIIPIFILITIALQFIGTEIMEEKSTKAIEIIIASVPPRTHFFAKILSIMIFLIVQLLTYVVFGLVGFGLNELIASNSTSVGGSWSSIVGILGPVILPTLLVTLVCAVLGALIYAIIGGFFASLSVNQEDYQAIQTPVMMILMISYMGGIFAGASQLSGLLLFFGYFPFSAPLVLPVAFAAGQLGWLEVVISFAIMIVTAVGLLAVFTPLYRASILSYDQSSLFKRIKNTYRTSKVLKDNQKLYEGKK